MRVIIVDDEPEILEDIKDTIQEYEGFEVAGVYTNPLAALADIERTNPECAFLDIEMPGMSGIDLAEKLLTIDPRMEIIFITAFNHYATQAFEVNAMDYVLKPVNPKRFEKTIERLCKNKDNPSPSCHAAITLRSFGYFEVLADGNPVKWCRSKAKELLAYLLHFEGHKKTKYKICEDLWPEHKPKQALVNLQTAMCSLRKSLGAVGCEEIRIEFLEESYLLTLGNVIWDAREFERLYASVKTQRETDDVKKALSLYQGEYMGSEDWTWSQLTAESLGMKYEELLKQLADRSFQNGDFHETVETVIKLAQRQAVDKAAQLMLAQAAYACSGTAGLRQKIGQLRSICQKEHDMDIDPKVFDYCAQKSVNL